MYGSKKMGNHVFPRQAANSTANSVKIRMPQNTLALTISSGAYSQLLLLPTFAAIVLNTVVKYPNTHMQTSKI